MQLDEYQIVVFGYLICPCKNTIWWIEKNNKNTDVCTEKKCFCNLVEGCKKEMSTLSKFLQVAKELNIPCRNLTSTEDLKEAIKDTIMKHKEIIFDVDSSICIKL